MKVRAGETTYEVTPIPPYLWSHYNLYQRYISETPTDLAEAERWEKEKTKIWDRLFRACCDKTPDPPHQARVAVEIQKMTQKIADEVAEARLFRFQELFKRRGADGVAPTPEAKRPNGNGGEQS